ncbi:hypothetical protein FH972_010521 [Carpinus fangiana]|uniref:Sulfotransferase n=1 Tax=Carpinus fangiana TaxID=176857 RepID=A0A660KNK1_9ROSI|nr:hypothetical protein FH972_010521 [Carpinus fangiana]
MDPPTSAKLLLDHLPKGTFFEGLELYRRDGFWYRPRHLEAAMASHSQFEARDDDVILASAMKTGSTWLKALCFCIMQSKCDVELKKDEEDLLALRHPAFYVQTLEVQVYTAKPPPDLSGIVNIHFHTTQESVKVGVMKLEGSGLALVDHAVENGVALTQ